MRYLAALFVVFLVTGCGNYRHQYLNWPARLVTLSDFSANEEKMVRGAIDEFNQRSGRNLIVSSDTETDSEIIVSWASEIPRNATEVAGRATIEVDKCTVQISSVVSSDEDFLKPVLWHELGHCAGLEHDEHENEIMYKTATYFSKFTEEALVRFLI